MGLFSRFHLPRRRGVTISEATWQWVMDEHPILAGFEHADQELLRSLCERFLAVKQIFSVGGDEPSDELLVSIAAQACLPILRLDLSWYRDWATLYLTPEEYQYDDIEVDEAGVVHEISDTVSGQVFPLGSVALSVADVEASGWCDGYNVVIHEMAHILDRQNGALEGAPPLHREMDSAEWQRAFSDSFMDFQERVVGSERRGASSRRRRSSGEKGHRRSHIDSYGAESPEEFFAVASETFFEQPWVLPAEYPKVHDQLVLFYRQNPLDRIPSDPRKRRKR